ncbi:hypothetical protein KK062_00360 [Fulvivirgaceae bacterium PWU5]|uniref:DoxX family membrane protein n=1 Tax=Dawidia cretensis TaxID=2782350 RepID=A0AAP2GMY7_9BACT|nr:hypothetical protein [Dawidia cretensis]MBT1706649.1 hypothetical protein [Dawidia cretensis]
MEKLTKAGNIAFGLAMACVGIHQLFYGKFCVMIVPDWPVQSPAYTFLAYVGSILLAGAGLAIAFNWYARVVSLLLGGCLLMLLVASYIPFEFLHNPYYHHIATWANAFKELAFAGGAFVVAGTYKTDDPYRSSLLRLLEKLIPAGHWFFSITMIIFGCIHFLYLEFVQKLVPAWMPYPQFWTAFTGACLIGSGLSIVTRIQTRLVANLLALMILLWFFMIHIPRAIATPFEADGNEVTSALSALAFCGTAVVIANAAARRREQVTKHSALTN